MFSALIYAEQVPRKYTGDFYTSVTPFKIVVPGQRLTVRALWNGSRRLNKRIYMYFMCTIAVYSEKFYNKN